MSVISDIIYSKMDDWRVKIEKRSSETVPSYLFPVIYTIGGFICLILIPSAIFTMMEDWDLVDAVYYSFISLSTIGFGDYVPRNEPPIKYASYARNDTACFEELINPIPSKDLNVDGLSRLCNPTIWPEEIELLFNMYRVGVFFWILMGLVWLSGVISIITELLQANEKNGKDLSFRKKSFSKLSMRSPNTKLIPSVNTKTFVNLENSPKRPLTDSNVVILFG